MGFLDKVGFAKIKEGLTKTREGVVGKVTRLVTAKSTIDDAILEQLEEILIGADVGVSTTVKIVDAIRERVKKDKFIDAAELNFLLRDEIQRQFVNGLTELKVNPFDISAGTPHVIMVVGINGVGKTTTIGKLAMRYKSTGRKVVVAAADTFRAAANEQLEVWADRAGATIIQQSPGSDPAAVAYDALSSAISRQADVVIIDTAGRLHTKVNLMEELKKIKRVIAKKVTGAPQEVLLVLDASTGQNGLQQAKKFRDAVDVSGIVLTKLDGTAKGGIVLAITMEIGLPVRFIGVGEGIDDLQPFDRKAFVEAMFGE